MTDYRILHATLRQIVPNIENRKFSAIAESDDGRYFQIKFCEPGGRHNINEFIAHYVSTEMGAPVVDGVFLSLSAAEMQKLSDFMVRHPGVFNPIDTEISHRSLFFGVQWEKDTIEIKEYAELVPKVSSTVNRDGFFALYPLDQYLKNYDRHLGNHLIVKYANALHYRLIDFDRIFGGTDWSAVSLLMNDFGCLSLRDYHRFLYSVVTNDGYEHVLRFSNNISMIDTETISDIIDTISQIYTVSQHELDMIRQWLSGRSRVIYDTCLGNNDCFVNVRQKRLNVCSSIPDHPPSTPTDTHSSSTITP